MADTTDTFGPALRSQDDFLAWLAANGEELARRTDVERRLAQRSLPYRLDGFCAVCGQETEFSIGPEHGETRPDGGITPNWREQQYCARCGLSSRMRMALHHLMAEASAGRDTRVYITERITPLFRELARRFAKARGSEYLGADIKPGKKRRGVRHEDVTRLSFRDGVFDHILTFDVLEHVPDYPRALAEFVRCLAPGGALLLTVPFGLMTPETVVRAVVENGGVRHILPPEYHGDPLGGQTLCYYHFGWSLLQNLRDAGFADAWLTIGWSERMGYLGGGQFLIQAVKARWAEGQRV